VEIAGRALNFPNNTGIDGPLELWEVNPFSGERMHPSPDAVETVDATGDFGPWPSTKQRYEIHVIRQASDGTTRHQHFYSESWIRSDSLVRLNISPIGSTLSEAIRANSGPATGASISRQKEWWGNNDVDATNVDVLDVETVVPRHRTGFGGRLFCLILGEFLPGACSIETVGNIVTPGTAPYAASTIAMITFDVGVDGVSDTSQLVPWARSSRASTSTCPLGRGPERRRELHLDSAPRAADQWIMTPNWPMDGDHYLSVGFREWTQDIDTWVECQVAGLCP
jgi:hypothetical protein